jgi:hypothetical protein
MMRLKKMTVRTLMLGTGFALVLISPAYARHIYHYSLCTPAQKQTDRDPVTSIVLERYAQSLDVKFHFASGKTIKRSEQYEIESDDDGWHGKSIKGPNLVMRFKIEQRTSNTSEYLETIHNLTTGKDTFVTAARCHEVQPHEVGEEDDIPQPGEEGYKPQQLAAQPVIPEHTAIAVVHSCEASLDSIGNLIEPVRSFANGEIRVAHISTKNQPQHRNIS